MKYLISFKESLSHDKEYLYKKIQVDWQSSIINEISDRVNKRGGYSPISEKELSDVKNLIKGYKINKKGDLVTLAPQMIGGTREDGYRIYLNLPHKDVDIVKDKDDFYYVTIESQSSYRQNIYYECDTFDGVISLLHEVVFRNYKKQNYDIEMIRKSILQRVNKMSNDEVNYLNKILNDKKLLEFKK